MSSQSRASHVKVPAGSYDCKLKCHNTYEVLTSTINRLQKDLQTLKLKCAANQNASSSTRDDHTPSLLPNVPTIHMITPTYSRWTQKADLTRLCQTLMHVKNLNWILVEDSDERTGLVTRFLKKCRVKSTHLNIRTKKELQRNVIATYIFLICIVRGTALCACLPKDLLLSWEY